MKLKKLTAFFASLTMLATIAATALTAYAVMPTVPPVISLSAGEYYTAEDSGVTYYMIDVDVNYSYDQFVAYDYSGIPTKKTTVRGISAYGFGMTLSSQDFMAGGTVNHLGQPKAESKFNWTFGGASEIITSATGSTTKSGKLGTYTIFTTNPKAATTLTINDSSLSLVDMVKDVTDSKEFEASSFATNSSVMSIDIPAYEADTTPVIASVAINEAACDVAGGTTKQFTATVTTDPANDTTLDKGVNWSATAGSIDANGLFTAPAAAATAQSITVTAESKANSDKKATVIVTVPAKPADPTDPASIDTLTGNTGAITGSFYYDLTANGNGSALKNVAGSITDKTTSKAKDIVVNFTGNEIKGAITFKIGISGAVAGNTYTAALKAENTIGVGAEKSADATAKN